MQIKNREPSVYCVAFIWWLVFGRLCALVWDICWDRLGIRSWLCAEVQIQDFYTEINFLHRRQKKEEYLPEFPIFCNLMLQTDLLWFVNQVPLIRAAIKLRGTFSVQNWLKMNSLCYFSINNLWMKGLPIFSSTNDYVFSENTRHKPMKTQRTHFLMPDWKLNACFFLT